MLTKRRGAGLGVILLAAAISLAGCSASGGASSAHGGNAVAAPGAASDAQGSAEASTTVITRQVVTTGSEVIRTAHPISAADRAATIVDGAGGRVDDRNQTAATATAPAEARLTLRIPSGKLTQTLTKLKKVGSVVSITESTDDVTTKSEDLNARINALQTSITRLLALEAKADNTSDLIQLENDISTRQGDLESLQAQQRYLGDQVAMATIKLHLIAPSVAVAQPGPPSAASAFVAGFAGFGTFFTWVFLVLSYLVPWLVLAAIIWIGIVLILRIRRRRRAVAEAGTASAPPPAA